MLAEVLLGLLGHVACHVDTDNTHVGIIRLIKPTVLCLADDQQRLEEAEQM